MRFDKKSNSTIIDVKPFHHDLDPLDHRVVSLLQIRNFLLARATARRGSSRHLQPVMNFSLHNHPIIPPAVPLARGGAAMYTAGLLVLCWK
jgi:hypothetical protein